MAVGAALAAMVPRWERGYRQAGVETPETPYLELALIFATAIWIWETYLSVRQYRRIRALEGRVPDELEDTVAATGGGSDNISALGDEHKTPQKAPRRNTTNTAVDLSQADVDELLAVIGYHRLMHEVAARNLGAESKKKKDLRKALRQHLQENSSAMAEVAAAIEEDEATKAAKTTFAENAADVQYLSWNDLQSQAALLGVKSPSRKRADLEDAVRSHLSQSTTESDDGTDVGQGEAPSDDSPDALIDKLRSKSEKTFHYNAEHMQYQIMYSLWNRFLETAELLLGLSPFAWDMSKSLLAGLGFEDVSSWPILQAIVYLQGLRLVQSVIDLPWSAYSTFHIEAKHGFNKTTVETFVMDFIKDTGLTLTLGSVVLAGMLAVMSWANVEGRGHLFFLYIWAFIFAVTLFFMFIAPTVIMPLFNEFTPLEKSSLLDRIEDVAAQPEIQFPVKKVFVVDGSRRSGHSNAFFFGFFKNKRVVLYDTLLSQVSENEIVAVLCHEFGHWRHGHVLQNFVVSQTFLLTTFFFYASFREDEAIYASFGFKDQNLVIGLFLFLTTVWAPVSTAFGYILTLDSRRKEFEADRFAVRTGHGDDLQRGLLKISLENLGNLDPDWIYSAFNHTHPPLVQRLRAISQYSAELQKKTL